MVEVADKLEQAIGSMMGYLRAENLILREMLSVVIGLGLRSNAWSRLEAEVTLAQFAEKLVEASKSDEAFTARSHALRDFAMFAAAALHNPAEKKPGDDPSGSLQ